MSTMAASTNQFLNMSKPEQAAYLRGVFHTLIWVGIIVAVLLMSLAGVVGARAEEHCQTMPGEIYCWDTNKGGAPMDHIEKNQFGGIDIRHQDGSITRCTKRAGTPAMWDCREIK